MESAGNQMNDESLTKMSESMIKVGTSETTRTQKILYSSSSIGSSSSILHNESSKIEETRFNQ